MKPLIIPIAIGLLAGLGGGSSYAYVKASQQHVLALAMADSLKQHGDSTHADSTHAEGEHADGEHAAGDSTAADSAHQEAALPMTPADSIRAQQKTRAAMKRGDHDAGPVTTKLADVKPVDEKSHGPADSKTAHAPEPSGSKAVPKAAGASTVNTAVAVKDARDVAMHTALPEQRLAKIFGAMAPKDAAKVLDQMSDSDVRAILALMGDKQAGSILAAFPAARAAAVTRGAIKTPEIKP